MDFLSLLYILTAIATAIYFYLQWSYTYWRRRGLGYLEPKLFFGNVQDAIKQNVTMGEQVSKMYTEMKLKGWKHGGFYVFIRPFYLPIDLEVVKCVLQKDFNHFVNHGGYVDEDIDPLTGNLFSLEDDKWRRIRAKLTPTFTSGKMKMMFQTIVDCGDGLVDILEEHLKIQDALDIKDVLARFTTDVIGSCAFGIDCNSIKDPNSEFRVFGKAIFEPNLQRRLRRLLLSIAPKKLMAILRIKQMDRSIEKFFIGVVKNTVDYRETNNIYRKDFMHLLLQLKNKGRVTDDEQVLGQGEKIEDAECLTLNEIAAQSFVFFLAGFETSSTTMTFALLELAQNQAIQNRLRSEIQSVLKKHEKKITYAAIMEMEYLDKVINETLRRHPPLSLTPRECNKDYEVPGTNVVIEKGTRIFIPIQAIHMDPEYYSDPENFDPERFNEENKARRPGYAYLPFGEGPRMCIGARFGLMQTKVGLVTILRKYRITLNRKTKVPITYNPKAFITTVKGDVWLDIHKLEN